MDSKRLDGFLQNRTRLDGFPEECQLLVWVRVDLALLISHWALLRVLIRDSSLHPRLFAHVTHR